MTPTSTAHSPVIGDFTGDGYKDIAFLVTDQRFETGGDYLFLVPLFPNNTAGAVVDTSWGSSKVRRHWP